MNDITASAQQQTTIPGEIGHAFADTWCGTLTADIAQLLKCEEVDVLAGLLRALGAEQAAAEWIEAHARADEHEDSHYQDPDASQGLSADAFRWCPGPEGT
ncbi:hypothetical protein AB5J52_48125 (plasmid) [Streptomyces sp. R39]|uniref:Uncharacterized protein n=1 Tax=Streptomyces sp. R39 TaxID=3238631 RepID=A0AB39R1N6_9ACTN